MREIKFRSWNKVAQRMIDLYKISPLALSLEINALVLPFNDSDILMQYIGIKDKNGKEIFEGDIVKRTDKIIYGVVKYNHHLFYMNGIDNDNQDDYFQSKSNYYQVIGNIYENPDLIKN